MDRHIIYYFGPGHDGVGVRDGNARLLSLRTSQRRRTYHGLSMNASLFNFMFTHTRFFGIYELAHLEFHCNMAFFQIKVLCLKTITMKLFHFLFTHTNEIFFVHIVEKKAIVLFIFI